jgi:hypothetical protein
MNADFVALFMRYCLPYFLFCCVLHFLLYAIFSSKLPKFSPANKASFYNRGVSTFHATLMFCLSVYYWVNLNPSGNIETRVGSYPIKCVWVMCGYLLYDTLFEIKSGPQFMTLAHHIFGGASHLTVLMANSRVGGYYW